MADFSPLLIAERLGHEKVETTLNTYATSTPISSLKSLENWITINYRIILESNAKKKTLSVAYLQCFRVFNFYSHSIVAQGLGLKS